LAQPAVAGASALARVGYRSLSIMAWNSNMGRSFGTRSREEIDEAYQVLAEQYVQANETPDWRGEVRRWLGSHRDLSPSEADTGVLFFERVFANTRCADHAWFGVLPRSASLVVGGIYLAAIVRSGEDKGLWLLVDRDPPEIEGINYRPVKSTRDSPFPLLWAHASSLDVLGRLVSTGEIWSSYARASEHILQAPRIASDRDAVQLRRGKRRLTDIWNETSDLEARIYPDEVDTRQVFTEGAVRQVSVNAYERSPSAREQCIAHFGTSCCVCGFNFAQVYGEIGERLIHVHHLRPLPRLAPSTRSTRSGISGPFVRTVMPLFTGEFRLSVSMK